MQKNARTPPQLCLHVYSCVLVSVLVQRAELKRIVCSWGLLMQLARVVCVTFALDLLYCSPRAAS